MGASRRSSQPVATRRDRIVGALDPVLATIARWADEDPEAMGWLLADVSLRSSLRRALNDVVGSDSRGAQGGAALSG